MIEMMSRRGMVSGRGTGQRGRGGPGGEGRGGRRVRRGGGRGVRGGRQGGGGGRRHSRAAGAARAARRGRQVERAAHLHAPRNNITGKYQTNNNKIYIVLKFAECYVFSTFF